MTETEIRMRCLDLAMHLAPGGATHIRVVEIANALATYVLTGRCLSAGITSSAE